MFVRRNQPSPAASVRRFLRTALRGEIIRRAAGTAALVGTILAAINHGPELVRLDVDARRWLQMGLTYLVPYCVATYAATMQELRHRAAERLFGPPESGPNGCTREQADHQSVAAADL